MCDEDYAPCTHSTYFSWKIFFDRALALVLLIPALPLIAILVAVVRLTSSGPGLFRQTRSGKDGQPFDMLKIRTMIHYAEAKTGPVWAQISDPRVTPVGRVLRHFHLDELPQLFNVLRGEMSLVGPRPERPEFVHVLAEKIPRYRSRLAIWPGVTGLAQLNLPPDSDMDSVRRKLVLDIEYLKQASLLLDTRILLCTALRIIKLPNNVLLRLFGLFRSIDEEQLACHLSQSDDLSGNNHHTPIRPKQEPRETSLRDTCAYSLSETLADVPKHLLAGLNLDDPEVRRCIQRAVYHSSKTAIHNLPPVEPEHQEKPKPR